MHKMKREILVPSVAYCLSCFAIAHILYLIMLLIDPLTFHVSGQTLVVSFIFVGVITTVCCSGGLAGLWWLTYSTPASRRDHVKAAVLIGAVASGMLTLAEDRLWLGAAFVAITTFAIAFVVKTYRQSTSE